MIDEYLPLDPELALVRVRDHFDEESDARVVDRAGRLVSPSAPVRGHANESPSGTLRQMLTPSHVPLSAYLACALTGLNEEQRQLVFQLSDTVSVICSEFDIDVYEPRKKTDPVHHAGVLDADVFRTDRERVLGSDLLIHLCHFPSTGSGQELDFAFTALLPILLVRHADRRTSRMITGIPSLKVELSYREPDELRAELRARLSEIRPLLEERKLAVAQYASNIVGERVQQLRTEQKITREELARATGFDLAGIEQIEENDDRTSNPSLLQLRMIAAALNTTAAELISPDFSELVMSELQSWLDGKQAARTSGLTPRDQRRLVRRVLLRVIDQ